MSHRLGEVDDMSNDIRDSWSLLQILTEFVIKYQDACSAYSRENQVLFDYGDLEIIVSNRKSLEAIKTELGEFGFIDPEDKKFKCASIIFDVKP